MLHPYRHDRDIDSRDENIQARPFVACLYGESVWCGGAIVSCQTLDSQDHPTEGSTANFIRAGPVVFTV